MPKIEYIPKKFSAAALDRIATANAIISEYVAKGFDLTLRQLYYAFVSRGFIPNTDAEYEKLGSLLSDARLAGLVDWDAIVDRTRTERQNQHWESPREIMNAAARSYRRNLWEGQTTRVVVYIEKDALVGLLDSVCPQLDVPYFSCRGYSSSSSLWRAAQKIKAYHTEQGAEEVVVLHLGDHDPSGIDMTRDIEERLRLFCEHEEDDDAGFDGLRVKRIALTMAQIRQYNPPPNPAKVSDSRAKDYITKYGYESWELDALSPEVITGLIEEHVKEYIDPKRMTEVQKRQEAEREAIKLLAEAADTVAVKQATHGLEKALRSRKKK